MLAAIETGSEETLTFSAFEALERTREAITTADGTLKYIATDYPLPFGTKLLEGLTDSTTRVFRPPQTMDEFRDTLYRGIEYLAAHPEQGSGLLWCPPEFIDRVDEVPGAEFLQLERIELEDSNSRKKDVFERASKATPGGVADIDIGEYHFRVCLAAALGEDVPTVPFERVGYTTEALYIPDAKLDGDFGLAEEFYLQSLGVEQPSLFAQLPPTARTNVHVIRLYDTLGEVPGLMDARLDKFNAIGSFSTEIQTTLFRIAFKNLCSRDHEESLESVAPSITDRTFIEELREAYATVVGDDGEEFHATAPLKNGAELEQYLGLLGAYVTRQELATQLDFARRQLHDRVQGFRDEDGYSEDIQSRVVERWGTFFGRLGELALIHSVGELNSVAETEEWVETLEPLTDYEEQTAHRRLSYTYFEPLNEARALIRSRQRVSKQAETLREIDVSVDNIPDFLDQWAEFVMENYPRRAPPNELTTTFAEIYDQFVDELVDSYDNVVENDEYNHISDVVESAESEGVTVTVVIDSFGYTDYNFIKQIDGAPELEPDEIDVFYSNIPSYTSSAMTTLLTGYPPSTTGIYGWYPVVDGHVHPLKLPMDKKNVPSAPDKEGLSYTLLQRDTLKDSGLTTVAEAASDLTLVNVQISQENEILENLRTSFAQELGSQLKSRLKTLTNDQVPEHIRKERDNVFVLYLKEFDSLLHERISIESFSQYYQLLSKFITRLVDDLRQEIANAYDKLAEGEYTEEKVRLTLTADHGKLTKYEREDILSQGNQSHEFSNRTLDDVATLKQAHRINFGKLEVPSPGPDARPYIALCDEHPTPPYDRVRSYLGVESEKGEIDKTVQDEMLSKAINQDGFKNNGSKFMFGAIEEPQQEIIDRLDGFPGIDTHTPPDSEMFTAPDLGVISRYTAKNNSSDHAHHGGTSLSEMAAVWLEYEGRP